MAKVELRLRTYRPPTDIGHPIFFYIRYGGKPYFKATEYRALEKDWNETKKNIRGSHPKGVKLQNELEDSTTELQIFLKQRERKGEAFADAWENWQHEGTGIPEFSEHFEERIAELLQARDLGNMGVYQAQLDWLRKWMGKKRIRWDEMNYGQMRKLVAYSDGLGHGYHTLRQRLSTYQAVWKDAARRWPQGFTGRGNPFEGLMADRKPPGRATQKHQPIDAVKKLLNYPVPNKGQRLARDIWLMAFYLRGAGIVDMLYMDVRKVDDAMYYELQRLKMPKKEVIVQVKLLAPMMEIILRWQRDYLPYVFPLVDVPRNDATVLPGNKQPEGTRQYANGRNNIDTRLKKISKELGLALPLSMKQARHSWVVAARDLGIPKEVIEQCVGHRGQGVMDEYYFGQFPQQVLDEANERVIELLA